jgi:hypothetical protein
MAAGADGRPMTSSKRSQRPGIAVPARVEREDVLLEHALKQSDDMLAVFED